MVFKGSSCGLAGLGVGFVRALSNRGHHSSALGCSWRPPLATPKDGFESGPGQLCQQLFAGPPEHGVPSVLPADPGGAPGSRAAHVLCTEATFWARKVRVPDTPHASHVTSRSPGGLRGRGPGWDGPTHTVSRAKSPVRLSCLRPRTCPSKQSEVTAAPRGLALPGWGRVLGAIPAHGLFSVSQGFLNPVRTGLIDAPRFPLTEAQPAPRTSCAGAHVKSQHSRLEPLLLKVALRFMEVKRKRKGTNTELFSK